MLSNIVLFASSHASQLLAIALAVSEFLGSFSKVKANSLFQLIVQGLGYLKAKISG